MNITIKETIEKFKKIIRINSEMIIADDKPADIRFPGSLVSAGKLSYLHVLSLTQSVECFVDIGLSQSIKELNRLYKKLNKDGIKTERGEFSKSDSNFELGYLKFQKRLGDLRKTEELILSKSYEQDFSLLEKAELIKTKHENAYWAIFIIFYPTRKIYELMSIDTEHPTRVSKTDNPEAWRIMSIIS